MWRVLRFFLFCGASSFWKEDKGKKSSRMAEATTTTTEMMMTVTESEAVGPLARTGSSSGGEAVPTNSEILAEIERGMGELGVNEYFVDRYVSNLPFYPEITSPEQFPPGHVLLPMGTMDHTLYMRTLTKLISDMDAGERELEVEWKTLIVDADASKLDAKRKREKHLLIKSNDALAALFKHVKEYRPIDVVSFHMKLRALIKKKARTLANLRIMEASDILAQLVASSSS